MPGFYSQTIPGKGWTKIEHGLKSKRLFVQTLYNENLVPSSIHVLDENTIEVRPGWGGEKGFLHPCQVIVMAA